MSTAYATADHHDLWTPASDGLTVRHGLDHGAARPPGPMIDLLVGFRLREAAARAHTAGYPDEAAALTWYASRATGRGGEPRCWGCVENLDARSRSDRRWCDSATCGARMRRGGQPEMSEVAVSPLRAMGHDHEADVLVGAAPRVTSKQLAVSLNDPRDHGWAWWRGDPLPEDFLAALAMVAGHRRERAARSCAGCGEAIDGRRRADAAWCTDACRKRDRRRANGATAA